MTTIGSAKADQLEALVHTIENATPSHTRLVIRNSEAWIASAVHQVAATPTIDEAANKALADAVKFGELLQEPKDVEAPDTSAVPAEADVEQLRIAALTSVRAFQTSLLDATPSDAPSSLQC